MKPIITLALLLCVLTSFSQWTRVQQLPSTNIFTLFHKDSFLYAGGNNVVYISNNKGQTWDTTAAIPQLSPVSSAINNIIVYKNELYVAAPSKGVFKSVDGGSSWQNINAGIFPEVSDFCEYKGDLYAATFGNAVYKLNSINRNSWLSFSNGLSNLSANLPSIAGNSKALIAGTLANGMYCHLPANSTTWEERFLIGRIDPNEGAYDIITAHDTLIYSGRTGKFYMSTDDGLHWNVFGNRLNILNSSLLNTRQALLTAVYFADGVGFNTAFLYIKKDSLQHPFRSFSVVNNHLTWKLEILGDKLWDASDKGLFFMSLSDLNGITAADDSVAAAVPVRFISFNANCETGKVLLTWKTAQEQNSSHFNIERSPDTINWTVIGSLPSSVNSTTERSYSFTDTNPAQNEYYRIAEYDLDGHMQLSSVLRSSCKSMDVFNIWPNPVRDILFINIVTGKESQAIIRVFDNKGALVKMQIATVLQGSNQLDVDMKFLPKGVYQLSVSWDNGQTNKTVPVLKN